MSQAKFERPPFTAIFQIALHARQEKTATTTATPRHAFFTFDKSTKTVHTHARALTHIWLLYFLPTIAIDYTLIRRVEGE